MKKILIGCLALVLLGAVVIVVAVGGIFILGLNSETAKVESEGVEFGKHTDQLGCQTEALRRLRIANKNMNIIARNETSLFLNGCFQTCSDSVGYCLGAPKEDSFIKARAWALEKCRNEELEDGGTACVSLFLEVSNVCLGKTKHNRISL